jgi:hypothetical protein
MFKMTFGMLHLLICQKITAVSEMLTEQHRPDEGGSKHF